tara:strand:- start:13142 stop:14053 length:912 start_codon:yes stop_codon:yes gene_type:complete
MNYSYRFQLKRLLWKLLQRRRVLILGDGRSGTTWLSELINFDNRYIDCFEPLHGRRIVKLRDRLYPTKDDLTLTEFQRTIAANLNLRRTIDSRRVPKGVLVKEITAHLIADYAYQSNFNTILLIRNPLAVAHSKSLYGYWHTDPDLGRLTMDSSFSEIHKKCMENSLTTSRFLEYVEIWCLLYRWAFRNLKVRGNTTTVIFYENLMTDRETQIERIFSRINETELFNAHKDLIINKSATPSAKTTDDSTQQAGARAEKYWLANRSSEEIDQAYEIVRLYGLYDIYNDEFSPRQTATSLEKRLA